MANKVELKTVKAMNPGVISKVARLSLIVLVNVVLNRTVVVDSDGRFDNLCGSHLQSQSELYYVSLLYSGYWSDWSITLRCYWLVQTITLLNTICRLNIELTGSLRHV